MANFNQYFKGNLKGTSRERAESVVKQNIAGYSCKICKKKINPIEDAMGLMPSMDMHITCFANRLGVDVDKAVKEYRDNLINDFVGEDVDFDSK